MLEVSICILHFSRCLFGYINKQVHSVKRSVINILLSHEAEAWSQLKVNHGVLVAKKKKKYQLTLA